MKGTDFQEKAYRPSLVQIISNDYSCQNIYRDVIPSYSQKKFCNTTQRVELHVLKYNLTLSLPVKAEKEFLHTMWKHFQGSVRKRKIQFRVYWSIQL